MLKGSINRIKNLLVVVLVLGGGTTVLSAGLPGEYLLTYRWRDLNSPHSPLFNPAIISEANYNSLRAAMAPVLGGEFMLWEFGLNVPLGLYHTAGITTLIEGSGYAYEAITDGQGRLVPTDNRSQNTNFFLGLSYAWHVWNRLSVGTNFNFAYQSNFSYDALRGFGLDLGVTYRVLRHPFFGDHVFGLSAQNLIAPSMGRSYVPDFGNTSEYSRNLRISLLSNFWESRIEHSMEFNLKDFFANTEVFLDDVKELDWDLNWRMGFWALRMAKAYVMFGFGDDALDYWGFAVGANVPSFNFGRDLSFFYQYNIMTEDQSDATSHTIYAKLDFGLHREERYARRMARLVSMSPNELYNQARTLYNEGNYWDAFFIFSRIEVEHPDFFRDDYVKLYRSSCQEKMDMRSNALKNYERVKSEYSMSSIVPPADLGIMRIHYRNNNLTAATNSFVELNKPGVPDSIRHHGNYLMAQIFLQQGEINKAIQSFSIIPEGHPDYLFAQHAVAVAHAQAGSDMGHIIAALENCISIPPQTPEQQEIVNRSYVFLGYIFYEDDALARAVVALRQVPENSIYIEDALLGKAWTALKAGQAEDCISAGRRLVRQTDKPVLVCEGKLVQAYGHLLRENHEAAFELLSDAHDLIVQTEFPDINKLNARQDKYYDERDEFDELAQRVEDISNRGHTALMVSQLDSIHNRYDVYREDFRDFYRYESEFGRTSFFSRNIFFVKEDIEYALATVQNILGRSVIDREERRQQREIEEELERLRRELQEAE
ncbi:tetratricopeptide repeat protein [Chitinispirillales bacterium ANBcel5]|uniref:tetratricopeptide repeat protein n=1 Tax=Cellulosispirillum alkaliphilum TaxID=3039283 RepID=UPI002A4F8694|nr:tetratricopeptide repeat protein [Chitinispirillales bacterium ANBcel5]